MTKSEGFIKTKGSRIQGFKWKKIEDWRVGGLATHLHFQTSNLLQKGIATHLTF
ncbi:MAG TPA: hypothetical protein PLT06_05835 [Syntrophorhabdaceae bacterium]|nr:hypothetical protein [Syntrophorhabdaceae bacterium]HOG40410.1 hypothetical protein [Syntrophorhabdaceae bacterium]HQJ94344.1 hypothetical protein [Syntrophorhabdaceae bacterium]